MTDSGDVHAAVDYLIDYAETDWVMLSVVVSEARGIAGPDATKAEVVDATLALAASLVELGSPPGDLVDGEPGFAPWPGGPAQQLVRLRNELGALLAQDRLPVADDICWFHRVEG